MSLTRIITSVVAVRGWKGMRCTIIYSPATDKKPARYIEKASCGYCGKDFKSHKRDAQWKVEGDLTDTVNKHIKQKHE